ncbi:hypothetical protein Pint_33934 [Pistacia integerrima]|uniref:Uncharacterized protein n=1 Tax=Pistacia integerrima TaxID=434235 RepID=A0ACC0X3E5_9ROSI|nr:hypothetical protein Pint_33934 [Pistacia integerrima]
MASQQYLPHEVTSCGKVCNIIIDGESCKNVIASTMINKLSLQTQEHLRSYKLSWFTKF